MYNLRYCATALFIFWLINAQAQLTKDSIQQLNEVVVTATKFEIKNEELRIQKWGF